VVDFVRKRRGRRKHVRTWNGDGRGGGDDAIDGGGG